MKIEDYDLKELIAKAAKAGACVAALCELKKFDSVEDLLENADEKDVEEWVAWYAGRVLGGRWPEVEHLVLRSSYAALSYIGFTIRGSWPEAESVLLQNYAHALRYACLYRKTRWPEAEALFLKHAQAAAEYSYYVIEGRWPEAEPTIATDIYAAYDYAKYVIKGRWPEAEDAIKGNACLWRLYLARFPDAKLEPEPAEESSDED